MIRAKIIAFFIGLMMTLWASLALGTETTITPPPPTAIMTPADNAAVVSPLKQGQTAPFTGLLYSPAAAATVIAERNAVPAKIKIEVDAATSQVNAQCDFKVNGAKIASDADARVSKAILDAKDAQIKSVNDENAQLVKYNSHHAWWAAGGFVAGAIVTTVIVFGVRQAITP